MCVCVCWVYFSVDYNIVYMYYKLTTTHIQFHRVNRNKNKKKTNKKRGGWLTIRKGEYWICLWMNSMTGTRRLICTKIIVYKLIYGIQETKKKERSPHTQYSHRECTRIIYMYSICALYSCAIFRYTSIITCGDALLLIHISIDRWGRGMNEIGYR